MFKAILVGAALVATAISVYAEENLIGKWSGSHTFASAKGTMNINFDLDITSVEGNVVKGTAKYYSRSCAGDYQMTGKLDGNTLGMISTNTGGSNNDCKFGFKVTVEGGKMTGKIGSNDLTASKK